MIISRTPYRISFFGGGTDLPTWYRDHGGNVLSTTINRYCYLNCRYLPPFFDYQSRVVWSKTEQVNDVTEIEHPVVREALQMLSINEGVEIHHNGDLPAQTGLGSSSSFTVGLLHALFALKGQMKSKEELANLAIHLEQVRLKENVGVQDQIAAAYGGFNRIEVFPNDTFRVEPILLPPQRLEALENRLLMFYTGVSRFSSSIAAENIKAIPAKNSEMTELQNMVQQGVSILNGGDLDDFGRLLHEGWLLKRSLNAKVSPGFVDDIYDRAVKAGALGGKLLGAGGGGFMVFYVTPDRHVEVLKALEELLMVPVYFENNGTQIIFYDISDRYSRTALNDPHFIRYTNGQSGGTQNNGQPSTQHRKS